MKPINVSVRVPRPREEVFDFLDVLSNHVCFTDHMLTDWTFAGAPEGVGSKARLRANVPGPAQWMDMEVIASQAPRTTTEESVGAGGRRRTRGTYTLEELPGGDTDIRFTLEYLQMPPAERILAPLTRAYMKRANAKAMRRLGEVLSAG
jgi:hypothetical protein